MESTASEQIQSQVVNGNGLSKETAPPLVVQSPQQPQRPRKLSFDDSDMELTKLKLGASVHRFPASKILTAATVCAIVTLLVRYLLPFNSGSFKAALVALERGRQAVADRIVLDYNRGYAALHATMKDAYDGNHGIQEPSLVVFAMVFAAVVTWFTYYVVYLDSSIPGVNPPTPFSASKKKRFSDKERRFHLGYVTALLSGLTVFMIIVLVE